MKRFICVICCVICIVLLCGCGLQSQSYLRIHIRANSNCEADQNVKYKVKDLVVTYLEPYVQDAKSVDQLKETINSLNSRLTQLINNFLCDNGFNYGCSIAINNEFFPTRTYESLTLKADYYDAIIIELGEGKGNNWWCVVYPPLCFTGNNVVYKSKIVELIKKYL